MNLMDVVRRDKIIAIVRGLETKYMLKLAENLYEGGITMLEVTFNQKDKNSWQSTVEAISEVGREFKNKIIVGAGTVINLEQLNMAHGAGAKYMVSPNVNQEIIKKAKDMGMYAFPGALTPTEAIKAHEAGADAIKIFPISSLGPGYLKAIKAPLSHIDFLAVGGINEKNAGEYIKAGAVGLGVGGNIVNKEWIEGGQWDKIKALAKEYVKATQI